MKNHESLQLLREASTHNGSDLEVERKQFDLASRLSASTSLTPAELFIRARIITNFPNLTCVDLGRYTEETLPTWLLSW